MRTWNEYITVQTKNRQEIVDLTPRVSQAVTKAEILEGIALIASMHNNAGVFIGQEDEPLHRDLLEWLEGLAPEREGYQFSKGESNAGAYLKNLLTGQQVALSIENGKPVLGPWQRVFFAEFDGGRPKRVLVKVLGE
jgi:secondary thiamine-phosphate synthase enzyme